MENVTNKEIERSEWNCHFMGDNDDFVFTPVKGNHPNLIHRKLQELAFGLKWKKKQ